MKTLRSFKVGHAFRLDNERLNYYLKNMKEENLSLKFQLDYTKMNLKRKNVEMTGMQFVKTMMRVV